MVSNWINTTLGEVIELKRGYDLPKQERQPGRFPLVSSAGISDFQKNALVKGPGVVTGRYGTLGEVFFIEEDFWPLNTTLYVSDFKGNDPRFISYLLKELDFMAYSDKAAVPGLNRNHLHQAPVHIPSDIGIQRAIASILGRLDDKIELNRRTCETLEEIAKVIFKSWFVDFDPVRAKIAGENPASICIRLGLPREILDLFPNKLVGSNLGVIPEGWKAGTFSSIVSKRNERVGSQKVIILSAISSGKLVISDNHFTKKVYSEKTDKYLLVEQWDFAFNPSRINIGSIGLLEEDLKGGVSPVYIVIRPDASYRWFLKFYLQHPQTRTVINTLSSGSVRQSLSFSDFSSIPSVIPPVRIAQEFDKQWLVFYKTICALQTETSNLKSIRDELLPKLISGEIEVTVDGGEE